MRARHWLKRALANGERIDLVHQLKPLALRYPSPAIGLGAPVLVGPLAGSVETPQGFEGETSGEPWYVKLRRLDRLRIRHDPLLRRTYESAAVVIGVAPYVRDVLGDLKLREFALESETGIAELPDEVSRDPGARPFRLLFVGRIVRAKGVRDLVRALAQVKDLDVVLDVVGQGNDLDACRAEAARLGVAKRITFHGGLPRERVDAFYAAANAFVFPSFREPSGNVVLEAMSWGLPMVVADRGGPAFVVGLEAGMRVFVDTPEQFARDIAGAIRRLVTIPGLAASYGAAARELTEREHLWPAKIERVLSLYERVAAGR